MLAVLVISLVLAGPLAGVALGLASRRLAIKHGRMINVSMAALLMLCMAVLVASVSLPGPASRYVAGSVGWYLRSWLAAPGIGLLIATPTLLALAAAAAPQQRYRPAIFGLVLAYAAMVPMLFAVIFVGCNHAGACL